MYQLFIRANGIFQQAFVCHYFLKRTLYFNTSRVEVHNEDCEHPAKNCAHLCSTSAFLLPELSRLAPTSDHHFGPQAVAIDSFSLSFPRISCWRLLKAHEEDGSELPHGGAMNTHFANMRFANPGVTLCFLHNICSAQHNGPQTNLIATPCLN